MSESVFGKTIVLTGAAGGIGSAIAKRLSDAGAKLVLVGRKGEQLHVLNRSLGGQHYCVAVDLADSEQRTQLLSFCQKLDSGIDMLINNAGISQFSLLSNMHADDIEQLIAVNLSSPIILSQLFLPLLGKKMSASIINIGSTFGSIAFPGFSVYSASKYGLRGFTEALRRELSDTTIKVRYFSPRAVKTAINSTNVEQMNNALGSSMDEPELVAKQFMNFIEQSTAVSHHIGWPEKLFVNINSVLPKLVDKSISKQLPIIKRYL